MFKPKTVLFFLIFINSMLLSQSTSKRLGKPFKYTKPTDNINFAPAHKDSSGGRWIVYSDEDNNPVYSDTNRSTVVYDATFMEDFYVVKDQNNWILLSDRKSLKSIGWISKDNLLLWQCCLYTKHGIHQKAMIMNTLANIGEAQSGDDSQIAKFYKDSFRKSESGKQSKLFQIFFVYKKKNNSLLLGKDALSGESQDLKESNIYGWVDKDRIVPWNTRIAIEPNWEQEAANERRINNIQSSVFYNLTHARNFSSGKNVDSEHILWNADPYENRFNGEWCRFPILSEVGEGKQKIYRVGCMGEIKPVGINQTITQESWSEIKNLYNILLNQKENINFIFVIDGSTSMKSYLCAISSSIETFIENESYQIGSSEGLKIKFGAVIYRDQDEEEREIEICQMKNLVEITELYTFLNNIQGDKSDQSYAEQMNLGIYEALTRLDIDENQTNIIALIGDAGNHSGTYNKISNSKVIEKLVQYRASLLVFQANHPSRGLKDQPYHDFIDQTKDIAIGASNSFYRKLIQSIGDLRDDIDGLNNPPIMTDFENMKIIENSALNSRLLYCKENESNPTEILEKQLEEIFKNRLEFTVDKIDIIREIIEQGYGKEVIKKVENKYSTSPYTSEFAPSIMDFFSQLEINSEQLKIILNGKYQLFIKAYAPLYQNDIDNQIFSESILISESELSDLVNALSRVCMNYGSYNELIKKTQEAWVDILSRHIGNIETYKILQMPMNEVMQLFTGIPSKSSLLNISIDEFPNLSEEEFYKIHNYIKRKRDKLNQIRHNKDFRYAFQSNKNRYFWLTPEELP